MYPWANTDDDWYAKLVNGRGEVYGLARQVHVPGGIAYETWSGEGWIFATEGAGYFTGIGGITDAVPIDGAEAERLLAILGTRRPTEPPSVERFISRPGDFRKVRDGG